MQSACRECRSLDIARALMSGKSGILPYPSGCHAIVISTTERAAAAAQSEGGTRMRRWRRTAGLDRSNHWRVSLPAGPLLLCLRALTGCGGGGGNSATSGSSGSSNPSIGVGSNGGGTSIGGTGWTAGVFQPSSRYAAQCASPRVGSDPVTGQPYPDLQGTTVDENNWLRSWTNELYLWYREVPDLNPAGYSTTEAYFDLLKTSATTSTGHPKDKFHFTLPTQ